MKSILNVKRTSNLIKGIYSHNICSGIENQQIEKNICHSVPNTFDFSQNFCAQFYQVTILTIQFHMYF